MASEKQRRKESRRARSSRSPAPLGPFRHPDGDRRRRIGPTADEGVANKRAMQQFGAQVPGDPDDEDEDDLGLDLD